jgi:hypothetical protein
MFRITIEMQALYTDTTPSLNKIVSTSTETILSTCRLQKKSLASGFRTGHYVVRTAEIAFSKADGKEKISR